MVRQPCRISLGGQALTLSELGLALIGQISAADRKDQCQDTGWQRAGPKAGPEFEPGAAPLAGLPSIQYLFTAWL